MDLEKQRTNRYASIDGYNESRVTATRDMRKMSILPSNWDEMRDSQRKKALRNLFIVFIYETCALPEREIARLLDLSPAAINKIRQQSCRSPVPQS